MSKKSLDAASELILEYARLYLIHYISIRSFIISRLYFDAILPEEEITSMASLSLSL